MLKRSSALILVIVALLLAACGGGQASNTATSGPTTAPTVDPNLPTWTPLPPATKLPPTWTPRPSPTRPPAQPTIEITKDRPTATLVALPTYTPSNIPPTPTPAGPVLSITADMINQAIAAEMQAGSGGYFSAPPAVSFQDSIVLVSVNILTTPGDVNTARPLEIQILVEMLEGRIKVTKVRAYFSDDQAVFEDPVVDNILLTIEQKLNDLVVQTYGNPGQRFRISEIVIDSTGITIQTVTME